MNIVKYAEHRKANNFSGGSQVAVVKQLVKGNLDGCFSRVGKGYDIDAEKADVAWSARVDPTKGQHFGQNSGGRPLGPSARTAGAKLDSGVKRQVGSGNAAAMIIMGKAASAQIKAQMDKLELDKMFGRLIDAEEAERKWGARISAARSRLLLLPDKIAPKLLRITDVIEIRAIIDRELKDALAELSQ